MKTRTYENPVFDPNFDHLRVLPPKPVKDMVVTVLGCGTSSGVPLLACKCKTCRSRDKKNQRFRASIFIQIGKLNLLIDTAPDLRHQLYNNKIHWVDAALFTHAHADHIHGVDDLRSLNFLMGRSIACFGNKDTIETLRTRFDYIFRETQMGGGKPSLDLNVVSPKPFEIGGLKITPLPLIHGKLEVLGFRIRDFAYITDCNSIPESTLAKLDGLDVLILDCLRHSKHPTHLNVEASLALAKQIGAKRTFLTHMGHELEYNTFKKALPKGIVPAYDGLKIKSGARKP